MFQCFNPVGTPEQEDVYVIKKKNLIGFTAFLFHFT